MISEVTPAAMVKEFQFGKKSEEILIKQVESENITL
jgi:hypothetical protein